MAAVSWQKKQIQKMTKIPTSVRNRGKKGTRDFELWRRGAFWLLYVSDNAMTFARKARF